MMKTIELTSPIAPKDQVSRAAKMLAEEFVCTLHLPREHCSDFAGNSF